jgi:uncharacterized protein (TIGR03437 family)
MMAGRKEAESDDESTPMAADVLDLCADGDGLFRTDAGVGRLSFRDERGRPRVRWRTRNGATRSAADFKAPTSWRTICTRRLTFVGNRSSNAGPTVALAANAEGENPAIAPNTWVEIKGANLAPAGDSRIWQGTDFTGNQMPVQLDNVSVTVNGKPAYFYYISPTQINILTPPDALSGTVPVVATANGRDSAPFMAQAAVLAPTFFVFNGGPYVAAVHAAGGLIGPATLFPDATPAVQGETILIYANGFGPTTVPVVSGSKTQGGALAPFPAIQVGNSTANVQFAGLVGDHPITVTYNGVSTQAGTLLTVQR